MSLHVFFVETLNISPAKQALSASGLLAPWDEYIISAETGLKLAQRQAQKSGRLLTCDPVFGVHIGAIDAFSLVHQRWLLGRKGENVLQTQYGLTPHIHDRPAEGLELTPAEKIASDILRMATEELGSLFHRASIAWRKR